MLIVTGIVSIGLWWWIRPVHVEEDWAGPWWGLTARYNLRRGWDGRRYYVGLATLTYPDGQLAARANFDGTEYWPVVFWATSHSGVPFGGTDQLQEYWHEDGRKLNCKEWILFLSNEYFPRRIHGQVRNTEQEWRRALTHFESQFETQGNALAAEVPIKENARSAKR
jgi:hypothetical protein